ncbi:MAG: DUF3568 family protein [Verrucomicrobia bacterium]|nr:DUF3568 family protein [Verrucomicrobiota bacterium]
MKLHTLILRTTALVALASLVAFQSGCLLVAAGAAGAGTVAYVRGELDASLAGSYDSVVKAANRALDDLQFKKINETKDAIKTVLVARTADDKKVRIEITKVSDTLTKVEIRVGVFGNENLSRTILDKIQKNL